jgi:hypothetical protein
VLQIDRSTIHALRDSLDNMDCRSV